MGLRSLVLIVLTLACFTVSAEVRKWVDEDGQVHYEDSPGRPGGGKRSSAEDSAHQGLTPEQERLEKQKRVLEAMEAERRAKQEQKEKVSQERKELAAKCQSAKQELTRLQEARYLYRKGADGESQVLSDEEREAATAELEAAIKKWCK